ncbi:MAG TPA: hypothetical protein VJ385_16360 [Fibrobacteria bacterium]|nr:hypothetical protein [Fibrobacteria bacterium]
MSKKILPLLSAGILAMAPHAFAAFGFKLDGRLDKNAISKAYFEGDFHRILPPLEVWRVSHSTKSREDSIFVFKHLSVLYAVDSATRNKAESYMVQLLKLMPTIELVDMYLPDNIEDMFNKVKERYLKQQEYARHHDTLGRPLKDSALVKDSTLEKGKPEPKPAKEKPAQGKPTRSSTWVWWTAGAAGVAAVATTAVLLLREDSKSSNASDPLQP